MSEIIATRHIKSLYLADNSTSAITIIVLNRDTEPCDYITESARWFYRTLRGTLLPRKKLLNCIDFEYWFRRTAYRYAPSQKNNDYCITTITGSVANRGVAGTFMSDATLWYSFLQQKVGVGSDYHSAYKMDIDTFLDMNEKEAIMWANRPCVKVSKNCVVETQEYLQERIL